MRPRGSRTDRRATMTASRGRDPAGATGSSRSSPPRPAARHVCLAAPDARPRRSSRRTRRRRHGHAPTWTCCSSARTPTTRPFGPVDVRAVGRGQRHPDRRHHDHPRRGRRQRRRPRGGSGARPDPRGRGAPGRRPGGHHRRLQPRPGRLLLHRQRPAHRAGVGPRRHPGTGRPGDPRDHGPR